MIFPRITVLTENNKQYTYDRVFNVKGTNDRRGLVNVLLEKHPNAISIYMKGIKIWTK